LCGYKILKKCFDESIAQLIFIIKYTPSISSGSVSTIKIAHTVSTFISYDNCEGDISTIYKFILENMPFTSLHLMKILSVIEQLTYGFYYAG